MPPFLLDTNVLLDFAKGTDVAAYTEQTLSPFRPSQRSYISYATLAEIRSLLLSRYGEKKRSQLNDFFRTTLIALPIAKIDVVNEYADIDAYSQMRHPTIPNPDVASAETMGKNDLWIAATASVYGLTLVTSDTDFEHLNGSFLNRILIQRAPITHFLPDETP